jgi:hypothetical protein
LSFTEKLAVSVPGLDMALVFPGVVDKTRGTWREQGTVRDGTQKRPGSGEQQAQDDDAKLDGRLPWRRKAAASSSS